MNPDKHTLRSYFAKLGLAAEIADLYLALYQGGAQSISALSRSAGVERTKIYRLIDDLLESNLIELQAGDRRGVISAAPISNLRSLIVQKEQEVVSLQSELSLLEQVLARNTVSNAHTRVRLLTGEDSWKQMLDGMTASKGVVMWAVGATDVVKRHADWLREWADRCNQAGTHFQVVVARGGGAARDAEVAKELIATLRHCEMRHMFPDGPAIAGWLLVGGGLTISCQWQGKESFCTEVHDPAYAATQAALFESVWQQAKP